MLDHSQTQVARTNAAPAARVAPRVRSRTVDYYWNGSRVGSALFDERLIDLGPVAVADVPAVSPSEGEILSAFHARVDNGVELGIELVRVEPRSGGEALTTITGFLVRR